MTSVVGSDVLAPRARTHGMVMSHWIERLGLQMLYIGPFLWCMELVQNLAIRAITGSYGWRFPLENLVGGAGGPSESSGQWVWYSIKSLAGWVLIVAVFSTLDVAAGRRGWALWKRALLGGTIGFVYEFALGMFADKVLHSCAQIWTTKSPANLVYVSGIAWPLWCLDFIVFHWLTMGIRTIHRHHRGRATTRSEP